MHRPHYVCRCGPLIPTAWHGLPASHTSEPCINGWTDRDAIWVEDFGGPKEPCIRLGSTSSHGKGQFWGGRSGPLYSTGTLCGRLCENGWTDCDAIWIVGSEWPKESRVRWVQIPPWEWGILEERVAYSIETFCRELCRNGWTNRFAFCVVDSGGPKEVQVQSYSPGGANVLTWEGTLAPPDEYDWTVRRRRRCGLVSNYFDHLFSHMTQGYRKNTLLQYSTTNVNNHNVEVEKWVRKFLSESKIQVTSMCSPCSGCST